jgi:hypothetical protein
LQVILHRRELRRKQAAGELAIAQEYRRRGSNSDLGVLGNPLTPVKPAGDDWAQKFDFGTIRTMGYTNCATETHWVADIEVAAIKCFGTEDPGGLFDPARDEPYLIVTSLTPSEAFIRNQPIVRVWRSPTYTGIPGGRVFGENQLMFQDVPIGPYGIRLKLTLMEHEHGDEATLERKIREKGGEMAGELTQLAAGLAGIPVTEEMRDEAFDSAVVRTLGDLSVGMLTDILKDDIIDEKNWVIDGETLKGWVQTGFTDQSFIDYRNEIPPSFQSNFPRDDPFGGDKLFAGGGGSYKVYLRVIPKKFIRICDATHP